MDDRRATLLATIIAEHVKTAQPVGSAVLVDKYHLPVSSATVRNDMAVLEEDGYIAQPHTSAGRIPTAKGYQFYVERGLKPTEPSTDEQRSLRQAATTAGEAIEQQVKSVAKEVANLAGQSVVVGFGPYHVYYTGLSNIFAQPEFAERGSVSSMSAVVDHLDDVMARLFATVESEPQVMIGADNPFGDACASVITRSRFGTVTGIFGVLGPIRMDYDRVMGLVRATKELFES
ncbi:MAG: hypothetical protein AAB817_02420 [Patescibacteria group bacterium]